MAREGSSVHPSLFGEADALNRVLGEGGQDIHYLSRVFYRGASFHPTPSTVDGLRRARNSIVQYRTPEGLLRAGVVRRLVCTDEPQLAAHSPQDKVFFIIEPFLDLSKADAVKDPFRQWPDLQARLTYAAFGNTLEVINIRDLASHVAVCPWRSDTEEIERKALVIWSLDRVRVVYSLLNCALLI